MNKRPIYVTILGLLLIAAGSVGLVYHLADFRTLHPFPWENILITLLRVLAIISGVYMLRGDNWARWLAISWIALHVGISFLHSLGQVAAHFVMLAIFAFLLFRPAANAFFRTNNRAEAA